VHSRVPRSALRPALAGFAAAALALAVVLAVTAPEHREAPRSGEFAAAGRLTSHAVPGVAAATHPARFSLRFSVAGAGRHMAGLRVHSRIPCRDGRTVDDIVSIPLSGTGVATGHGAFTVNAGGVQMHGFFVSPDRATGTLTRSVGSCALAGAQWTARRSGRAAAGW
jgi:hypothetical protein